MGVDSQIYPGKFRAINTYKNVKSELSVAPEEEKIVVQFQDPNGTNCGAPMILPTSTNPEILKQILNTVLKVEDPVPYLFYVEDKQLINDLHNEVIVDLKKTTESTITIKYIPQNIFKVKPVTRCTSTLSGHAEAILVVSFSPDGKSLATGSGDTTVRIWDLLTETPLHVLKGHTNWVQVVSWSANCELLASGSMDSTICIWRPNKGELVGKPLRFHKQVVTSICWEPLCLNKECNRFASASKDGSVVIWDATTGTTQNILSQHEGPVTCIKWGANNLLYSCSRDRVVKVWDTLKGVLVKTLTGHGHWINFISLNTDYMLRAGPYSYKKTKYSSKDEMFEEARKNCKHFLQSNQDRELLVSCSDDFTMFLWDPMKSDKPLARMTGHQQPVNQVYFSPDGQLLASASFDKSVRIWNGKTGDYIATLRGHVGPVYQIAWSVDSRLILSGSCDSTLKIWSVDKKSLNFDLPGHADSVFAVDWDITGERIASGGKDTKLKLWRQ